MWRTLTVPSPHPRGDLAHRPPPDASAMARMARRVAARARRPAPALDALLTARGAVDAASLARARQAGRGLDLSLGEILRAQGAISEAELLPALAECHGLGIADLSRHPADVRLACHLSASDALALDAVPVGRAGRRLIVATCRPDRAERIHAALDLPPGHEAILSLAPRAQITAAQIALYGERLARLAEGQAPQDHSCRGWSPARATAALLLCAMVAAAVALAAPAVLVAAVFGLALVVFLGNTALKASAFAATLRADRRRDAGPRDGPHAAALHLPVFSILVPLYREPEIATALLGRLALLDYPRERLEVLLVVEVDDSITRDVLATAKLPGWVRVITVPAGHPRTKPRALNFALNFARGEIIGIYDAEDRPEPDQLSRVARRFAAAGPETACLQGRLDYYNARHNLLSRLFAIEYATWFRVLLPGVQRMGLVVPLGGTTLFLRRAALEAVGGWDAHNVTEDAELGLRLARRGYRTEVIETTTFEEANAAVLPWIRQRSRWQKGYLMTWAVAMRSPGAVLRDLGPGRFLAMQVQILFAVLGFLVAPLLWSLVIKPFGAPHPLDAVVGPVGYGVLAILFVASVCLSVAIALHATRARHLRGLRPMIPLSELYFLLATLSAWRAAAEMLLRPFWWAKTTHGAFGGSAAGATGLKDPMPSQPLPSVARRMQSTGDP
jgi:cellulose synthase/poly-beta-1,6-N-acetylglucosamine synthase-like glycosyltransferase